jgi:hypothetical protein
VLGSVLPSALSVKVSPNSPPMGLFSYGAGPPFNIIVLIYYDNVILSNFSVSIYFKKIRNRKIRKIARLFFNSYTVNTLYKKIAIVRRKAK